MNIKTGFTLTRSLSAIAAICCLLGFTAIAQTDSGKPLNAASLGALVAELKGVVSRSGPDAEEVAAISARWDARTDLRGKTRQKTIDLLYQDVKAVVKDSGVLYQVYSMFAFYKRIPDEPTQVELDKPNPAVPKSATVKTLVDLTFRMHPYVGIEEQIASLPGPANLKASIEEDRKNRIEGFEEALKVNKKLTADQKTFVRANYDQLIKIADKVTEDAITRNFKTEQWIKEGLQKSYTKLKPHELNELIVYFQSADGQPVLKYIRLSQMEQLITGNGGTLNFTEADKAEHDKFIATPLGKKFIAAYLKDAIAYEQSKENAVRSTIPNADGFAIYEPANLNKLFNKFVTDNYSK